VAKRERLTEKDFPEPGSVFVAPTADGRLAAGRVLRRRFEGGGFAALVVGSSWIGNVPPVLDHAELRSTLVLTHHSWKGQRNLFWTHLRMPAEFQIIGQISLSDADLAVSSETFGGWQSVPLQTLLQWRWDHDRESLLREEAEQSAAKAERQRQVAQLRDEYRRTLTLDSLADRGWLETWRETSAECRHAEVQQLLQQLVQQLQAQTQRTKPRVRKLLKQTVEALNRMESHQPFIATVEREELCEALEQIACAAGFPALADEIDGWRHW